MVPSIALLIVVLSVVVLFYNGTHIISMLLAISMLVIVLQMLSHYFFTFRISRFWLAAFFFHSLPVHFLMGPSLYFFVRGVLTDRPLIRWRDVWHFIPAALALIMIIPYVVKPWSFKMQVAEKIIHDYRLILREPFLFEYLPFLNFILRNVSILGYIIHCVWRIQRFDSNYPVRLRISHWDARKVIRFMRMLLCICLFGTLTQIPPYYGFHTDASIASIQSAAHPWMYIYTFILAFIPLILLFNPEILYGIPKISATSVSKETQFKVPLANLQDAALVSTPEVTAIQPSEGEDLFYQLSERIMAYMEDRKPYLDPDFTIESLAEQLEVPRNHLYYCFSNILKTRFVKLRSEYRIRHAKALIREGESNLKTLLAIGFESGFSSSSAFRSVFKEITGMSPREFQRSIQNPKN